MDLVCWDAEVNGGLGKEACWFSCFVGYRMYVLDRLNCEFLEWYYLLLVEPLWMCNQGRLCGTSV